MAGFLPPDSFSPNTQRLRLLPMRFERLSSDCVAVSNLVGDLMTVTNDELQRLSELTLEPGDGLYERAREKLLIAVDNERAPLELLALRLRSRMSFLRSPTALHIFVVTLRCEHSCPYCQVSRQSSDRDQYDMSLSTAMRALDVAMASPSKNIKIEFQGGEPLLNFDLIRHVVDAAKPKSKFHNKSIQFVIATNLAILDENILAFCKENHILLSTSLDGPVDLHNQNRPRSGGNSHALAVSGIQRAQEVLGRDRVGALMTTTAASLDRVEDIVDEYLALGLQGIFLRPLSPYGFAIKTKQFTKYDSASWFDFYERGLRYILEINRAGTRFPEFYASLLLRRMLTDRADGYVDLRSPAGIGLGALVYNYDGTVFASDEGRMLAEMGDRAFELGNLASSDYTSMVTSDKLVDVVARTLTQCAPQCSSCAFESHCGADPVYHHATQGEPVGIKPASEFCSRQKSIIGLLFDLLENSPSDATILRSWLK